MTELISMCGINCANCPAYLATLKGDISEKERIAKEWSCDEYSFTPEEITCYGCVSEGKTLMKFCYSCDIRNCGMKKRISNCAYCEDFPCEMMTKIYERNPEAKQNLNKILKSRSNR